MWENLTPSPPGVGGHWGGAFASAHGLILSNYSQSCLSPHPAHPVPCTTEEGPALHLQFSSFLLSPQGHAHTPAPPEEVCPEAGGTYFRAAHVHEPLLLPNCVLFF